MSPDNRSRVEINQRIHARLQTIGRVDAGEHHVRVLVPRQEITGADRQWAQQYEPGDVLRYSTGSKVLDIPAGGRSWFYERQAAGAFKHLETTLVPGERLYSGALVKRALKDGESEDGPRRRFFGKARL